MSNWPQKDEPHLTVKNRITLLYLLMLLASVAHMFEEVWGQFWIMDAIGSLGWFLIVNWVLLCIPVVLFYFVLQEERWAYYLSFVYAGFMILNGAGHITAMLITGRYFNGFAGAYSGIALLLIAPPFIYYLRKVITTK